MASATGIPELNPAVPIEDEEEPLLGRPGDVRQDDARGILFNLLLGTAILGQAGIWILAALVWSVVFTHDLIFFSAHPLLNSAGLLLLTQSILILQPTYKADQKLLGTRIHFGLNLVGISALLTGLVIIEINKGNHERFVSAHARLGLITYIAIVLQALVGFAQFYTPKLVFGSVEKGKRVYKWHRISGYAVLLLGLATVSAATQTDYNKGVLGIRLWAVLVASILVVLGVGSRIKKHKLGF